MGGQPAGAQPQTAVRMNFLTHDELQTSVFRNRSDRIFTSRYRHQRVDQRLRVQAHQMRTIVRQLAGCQRLTERLLQAIHGYRRGRIDTQPGEKGFNDLRRIARHHLDQIPRLPAR